VSPNDDTLIALGLIQKPRGLSGELAVWPYQAHSCSFCRGLPVVVKTEKTSLNTTIEYVKQVAKRFGVKLEGVDSREKADIIPFVKHVVDEISIDKGYVKIIKIDDYIVS